MTVRDKCLFLKGRHRCTCIDTTFQTSERLGLEGSTASNLLLINPEGKLVEGNLQTLERTLAQNR